VLIILSLYEKIIVLRRIFHRDKWGILISFKYDAVLTGLVRQIKGSLYSNTYKGWYVDDNKQNLDQINQLIKEEVDIDISGMATLKSGPEEPIHSEIKKPAYRAYTDDFNPLTAPLTTPVKKFTLPDNDDDEEIIPTPRAIENVVERKR